MADLIKQPAVSSPAAFMQRALDLAAATQKSGRGNAYGAVIVRSDRIIGEGANAIYAHHDPTAHGEVEAIKDACRRIGDNDLSGAVIYTSGGAPCPMCATACYWANLDRIYYAHRADDITDGGVPEYGKC
ncbi:MAG: nucleoside deaminase [Alphaproteobacteria bacterium]|nr:nucleoside deaminase [Alphaproteobacteria bacterium]